MNEHETQEQRNRRIAKLRAEQFGDDPIANAYAVYDSDPRVSGPDDFEAFRDAALMTLSFSLELVCVNRDDAHAAASLLRDHAGRTDPHTVALIDRLFAALDGGDPQRRG